MKALDYTKGCEAIEALREAGKIIDSTECSFAEK
jgi:hypothetical protein